MSRLPVFLCVALAAACSSPSGDDDDSGQACVPGAQQACACAGGAAGVQRCLPDGRSFGECTSCVASSSSSAGSSSASGASSTSTALTSSSAASSSSSAAPSSNSAEASSSTSAEVSSSSGPSCGPRAEEATCTLSSQCSCPEGVTLNCLDGQCLRACQVADVQDVCLPTQTCVTITLGTQDTNVCLTHATRDEPCWTEPCAPELSCQWNFDSAGAAVPGTAACHQTCGYGAVATGCTLPEVCLPSVQGWMELQEASGNAVPCGGDGGSAACHVNEGYQCLDFPDGPLCARPVAACGTAVEPPQLWEADGGAHAFRPEELCNVGPVSESPPVAGSRFCDPHRELPTPPETTRCATVVRGTGVGICLSVCSIAADGVYPASHYDCPGSAACDEQSFCQYPVYGPLQGGEFLSCGADAGCPEGSGCCDGFATGSLCITRTGVCTQGPARTPSDGGA